MLGVVFGLLVLCVPHHEKSHHVEKPLHHQMHQQKQHVMHKVAPQPNFRHLLEEAVKIESSSSSFSSPYMKHVKLHHVDADLEEDGFEWFSSALNSALTYLGLKSQPKPEPATPAQTIPFGEYVFNNNAQAHNTQMYKSADDKLIVLRRATTVNTGGSGCHLVDKIDTHTINLADAGTGIQTLPATLPIGFYELKCNENKKVEVFIIFNPWSTTDSVHLSDDNQRKEYVLNTQGAIWRGSASQNYGSPWSYDQFSPSTIGTLRKLFALKELTSAQRASPVYISRFFSKLVNSQDDGGVLVGNWGKTFDGGAEPWSWTGSGQIFKSYVETGPVKYGQCWVFAGLVCSLLRAVGIPGRPVTNFESGHNTRVRDRSIDQYWSWNTDKTKLEYNKPLSRDSVWNFHVWTEGYFTRTEDFSDGKANGWQAVDATPQELSVSHKYECGPASIALIKMLASGSPDKTTFEATYGADAKYDTNFVFAEVAAPRKTWVPRDFLGTCSTTDTVNSVEYCLHSTKENVGISVMTKAVGVSTGQDVVTTYKPRAGQLEEEDEGTSIDFTSTCEAYRVGSDVVCTVTAKAHSGKQAQVSVHWQVSSDRYFRTEEPVLFASTSFQVAPASTETFAVGSAELTTKEFKLTITKETAALLTAHRAGHDLFIAATCIAKGDDGKIVDSEILEMKVPLPPIALDVTCSEKTQNEGKDVVKCSAKVTNPLSTALSDTRLFIDTDDGIVCSDCEATSAQAAHAGAVVCSAQLKCAVETKLLQVETGAIQSAQTKEVEFAIQFTHVVHSQAVNVYFRSAEVVGLGSVTWD